MKKMPILASLLALVFLLTACGNNSAAATSSSSKASAASSAPTAASSQASTPKLEPATEPESEEPAAEPGEPEPTQSPDLSTSTVDNVDPEQFWNADHTEFDIEDFYRSYGADITWGTDEKYVATWTTRDLDIEIYYAKLTGLSFLEARYNDQLYIVYPYGNKDSRVTLSNQGGSVTNELLDLLVAVTSRLVSGNDDCPFSGHGVEHVVHEAASSGSPMHSHVD